MHCRRNNQVLLGGLLLQSSKASFLQSASSRPKPLLNRGGVLHNLERQQQHWAHAMGFENRLGHLTLGVAVLSLWTPLVRPGIPLSNTRTDHVIPFGVIKCNQEEGEMCMG